jgi:hypothetical protein
MQCRAGSIRGADEMGALSIEQCAKGSWKGSGKIVVFGGNETLYPSYNLQLGRNLGRLGRLSAVPVAFAPGRTPDRILHAESVVLGAPGLFSVSGTAGPCHRDCYH